MPGHSSTALKDGVTHLQRCRLERVRAEKMEAIVLGFLKELLAKPEKIDEMVQAYSKRMMAEINFLKETRTTLEAGKDKRRPIFANVIHFAELHPRKVRLGLYAPLMRVGSTSVQNGARTAK